MPPACNNPSTWMWPVSVLIQLCIPACRDLTAETPDEPRKASLLHTVGRLPAKMRSWRHGPNRLFAFDCCASSFGVPQVVFDLWS